MCIIFRNFRFNALILYDIIKAATASMHMLTELAAPDMHRLCINSLKG